MLIHAKVKLYIIIECLTEYATCRYDNTTTNIIAITCIPDATNCTPEYIPCA